MGRFTSSERIGASIVELEDLSTLATSSSVSAIVIPSTGERLLIERPRPSVASRSAVASGPAEKVWGVIDLRVRDWILSSFEFAFS